MTCKITLRFTEPALMLISLVFTVPVSCQSSGAIYHDLRREQRPWSLIRLPFNNTCQAGSTSKMQSELRDFESCSRWITAIKEFLWSCAIEHLLRPVGRLLKIALLKRLLWLDSIKRLFSSLRRYLHSYLSACREKIKITVNWRDGTYFCNLTTFSFSFVSYVTQNAIQEEKINIWRVVVAAF